MLQCVIFTLCTNKIGLTYVLNRMSNMGLLLCDHAVQRGDCGPELSFGA